MGSYLTQSSGDATDDRWCPDPVALARVRPLTDAERRQSLAETLADRPADGPIRVFAYGSLIWRRAFEPVTETPARLRGWYRHTCLWSINARGTADCPGLMFGLDADPGRDCVGIAQAIDPSGEADALERLWRREMHGGVYRPRWLEAEVDGSAVTVLAFVVNHAADQYVGDVPVAVAARYIAAASGERGPCADYYANTAASLRALGIVDPEIEALVAAVERARDGHRDHP